VRAIARAGAGVNNIPVAAMSQRGVPVFNAPGANANAVKELVLAGMLMAARRLPPALRFRRGLDLHAPDLEQARVEDGKKAFAGFELAGQTLGIVGLGRIGCLVADAAIGLGMQVLIGFDPEITVDAAWSLPSQVQARRQRQRGAARRAVRHPARAAGRCHAPPGGCRPTSGLMPPGRGAAELQREGVVDDARWSRPSNAAQRLGRYVCDFPRRPCTATLSVIALPHLGASTREAEENCAVMVVDQLRDYLEHGNDRQRGQLPGRRDGARVGAPRGHRQRQRAQHAGPDLHRDGPGRAEHPQHGQQVARRDGLHPGRRRQPGRRRGAGRASVPSTACSRCATCQDENDVSRSRAAEPGGRRRRRRDDHAARPQHLNRLHREDLLALQAHFAALHADPRCPGAGADRRGRAFCAGFHIGELDDSRSNATADPQLFEHTVDALEALPLPTVARLNGSVYGGATDLALACDFRVGVARHGTAHAAAGLGLHYYPSGLQRYVERLGLGAAKRLFLLAEVVPAGRTAAHRLPRPGRAGRPALDARVRRIVAGAGRQCAAGRARHEALARRDRARAHRPAAIRQREGICAASADLREGLAAFAARRAPRFTGR
jgi:enoyl-CoA hydratase/carnithine racemase